MLVATKRVKHDCENNIEIYKLTLLDIHEIQYTVTCYSNAKAHPYLLLPLEMNSRTQTEYIASNTN